MSSTPQACLFSRGEQCLQKTHHIMMAVIIDLRNQCQVQAYMLLPPQEHHEGKQDGLCQKPHCLAASCLLCSSGPQGQPCGDLGRFPGI